MDTYDGALDLLKRHSGITFYPVLFAGLQDGALDLWCVGFIEATFRHSLGPGAVRGIAPRWEREGVGEPFVLPLFHGGRPRKSSLDLTLRQGLGLPS